MKLKHHFKPCGRTKIPKLKQILVSKISFALLILSALTSVTLYHTQKTSQVEYSDINEKSKEGFRLKQLDDDIDLTGKLLEPKDDGNITKSQMQYKPKLFLHVGPLKTGTTSIQLNLLEGPGVKKFDKVWESDNYQIIRGFTYRNFGRLITDCLSREANECDYTMWSKLVTIFDEAYTNAVNSDKPVSSIQSLEHWSKLPDSDFTFSLLKTLLERWEVHVILFYRPLLDWFPSLYSQYRKGFMYKPSSKELRASHGFIQQYIVEADHQMVFPDFATSIIQGNQTTGIYRDTLGTYEYFKKVLAYIGQDQKEQLRHIYVLQTYAEEGVEHEFSCNLPEADNMCGLITNRSSTDIKQFNDRMNLPLDIDLIVMKAWSQGILSIPRHDAATAFKNKLMQSGITISDLPNICLNGDEKQLLKDRATKSEVMFGNASDTKNITAEFELRLDQELNEFCSVNASAVLQEKSQYLDLFDDCIFQSPKLINRVLNAFRDNRKWIELGCDSITSKLT